MGDGKKYVRLLRPDGKVVCVGTEEECLSFIMAQAPKYRVLADGRVLTRVLDFPDGKAYDVGHPYLFKVVDADGSIEKISCTTK